MVHIFEVTYVSNDSRIEFGTYIVGKTAEDAISTFYADYCDSYNYTVSNVFMLVEDFDVKSNEHMHGFYVPVEICKEYDLLRTIWD